jgi:SAM-dependent methyltransferase
MTESVKIDTAIYTGRYPYLKYRRNVWKEIVRYVQGDVPKVDTLIELGAGYCDFINQFPSRTKIGYELNPDMREFADVTVDLRIEDAVALRGIASNSVDLVFASNFLEHLDEPAHTLLLPRLRDVLKPGGRLILIQPNYDRCRSHYFDDETHQTVFSDKSMRTFLDSYGLTVKKLIPGFLPFSLKSALPKWPFLVRLYLMSPIKPFAAQLYVVAEKEVRHVER